MHKSGDIEAITGFGRDKDRKRLYHELARLSRTRSVAHKRRKEKNHI
jgi:hypothetical protein